MTLESLLEDEMGRQPGLTARELAREMSRSSGRDVHKRDINPILYRRADIFRQDGGYVPRWHLVGQTSARGDVTKATIVERKKILRLDLHSAPPPLEPAKPALPAARQRAEVNALAEAPHTWILKLMPWQRAAMTKWYRAGCVGIVEAVTGTGKTHLGLEAIAQCAANGQRATVLVPSLELMRQWRRRIAEFLPTVSVATLGGSTHGDLRNATVVVANINSAATLDLTKVGSTPILLVADEVHRYGASSWQTALRQNYRLRLGLTATLERSSDDAVEEVLQPFFAGTPVMTYTYAEAVPQKVVAPFDLFFLGVELAGGERGEYDELSRRIGNARSKLLRLGVPEEALQRELGRLQAQGGEIGKQAKKYANGTRQRRNLLAGCHGKMNATDSLAPVVARRTGTVIFTQTVEPAEECARRLRHLGVEALAVHGEIPQDERQDALDRLQDGSIAALVAPRILDEGIDVPNIDCGIVLSASRGRRQMIQRLGRVIRKKPDGRSALFLVVFAKDTVEDPQQGAHEGFIAVARAAARSESVLPSWTSEDLPV